MTQLESLLMVCEHLIELERTLMAAGIPITYRGQPWSANCREWVCFACWLDRPAIRAPYKLAKCVIDHDHRGTHDGQESGLVCSACHDAIMGSHRDFRAGLPEFPQSPRTFWPLPGFFCSRAVL